MQNYSFSVAWSSEDGEYVATSAEFPGLSGLAPTAEEAIAELKAAIEVAIVAAIEDGEPVPEPQELGNYSGQFRMRVPKSTHAALAALAGREGISLNQLVLSMIAEGLGQAKAGSIVLRQIAPLVSQCQIAAAQMSEGVIALEQTNSAAVSIVFDQVNGQTPINQSVAQFYNTAALAGTAVNRGTVQ